MPNNHARTQIKTCSLCVFWDEHSDGLTGYCYGLLSAGRNVFDVKADDDQGLEIITGKDFGCSLCKYK